MTQFLHHHGTFLCQEYQAMAPGQMKPYMDALLKSMATRPVFLGQVDVIHRELTFSKVIFLMIKGDFKS